jgi:hypothetical protein
MRLRFLIVIFCVISCACCSQPQGSSVVTPTPQITPTPENLPIPHGSFKHEFDVETKYDKFKDLTKISLSCKVYDKGPFALYLDVSGTYPQKSSTPPETVKFGLVAFSGEEKYPKLRHLIVLADGQRLDLGELSHDMETIGKKFYFETMLTSAPFRTVLQIANAQDVEMQLNDVEFKMPRGSHEALRDFTSRFAKP